MRLIDADALKKYIDVQKGRPFIGCTIGEALKIMTDEQPTIEERKTGQCKNCKMWQANEEPESGYCVVMGRYMPVDGYCCFWAEKDRGRT